MSEVAEVSEEYRVVFSKANYLEASKKKRFLNILVNNYKELAYEDALSVMVACVGEPGSGKSTLAMQIAMKVDPDFDVEENIVWDVKDLIEKVRSERERAFVYEEAGVTIFSRDFMTKINKAMSRIAQTYRFTKNVIVFNLPHISLVDKNIRIFLRNVHLTAVFKEKIDKILPEEELKKIKVKKDEGDKIVVQWRAFYPWRYRTLWVDDLIWREPEKISYDGASIEMGWIPFEKLPDRIYKRYEKIKEEWWEEKGEEWLEDVVTSKRDARFKKRIMLGVKRLHEMGFSLDEIAKIFGYEDSRQIQRYLTRDLQQVVVS